MEPLVWDGAFEQESFGEIFKEFRPLAVSYFPKIYFIAFAMAFLKQQKNEYQIKQRNFLLEKEKAETELNFLKAQLHPHFLFNTLNNLYVLTLKKSDKAPETVIKLSEILDYVLYEGKKELISVEKEIKLLDNYISLEQLRYSKALQLSFIKEVDDPTVKISPLLLLSIVENAFKYGLSDVLDKPEIRIRLTVKNQHLSFHVYNKKSSLLQEDKNSYRKGIGVSNTKGQLALTYSDYSFNVKNRSRDYLVELKINLKSTIHSIEKKDTEKTVQSINTSLPNLPHKSRLVK